jgi:ABC-2 type transport system permease protein
LLLTGWLEVIAKLMPSTLGVSATRAILLDGRTLGDPAASGALALLAAHTLVWVAAGWVAYRVQIRRALRDGRLGPA